MVNRTAAAGTVLYGGGKDRVKTLDIVAKGVVRASGDYCSIDMPAGSIIGIGEIPGFEYTFTYEAAEDVSLFSYPYDSEASLVALFKANAKLIGTLVAGCIRFARNMQNAALDTMEYARSEFARVSDALEHYHELAIKVGVAPRDLSVVKALEAPGMLDHTRGWHRDFVEDLFANEAKFKKDFFSIPSVGLGLGLTVNLYALESRDFMSEVIEYLDSFRMHSREFMVHYQMLKDREEARESASSKFESDVDDPSVHRCLDAIMEFASPDSELFDRFETALRRFINHQDRYGSSDEARGLRRDIAADYYEIYTAVFIKAADCGWKEVPLGVRMFLLFGYVDEKLAGSENAAKLAAIANSLKPGADNRVMTAFEWLMLVYRGKVMPSKNEFDLDYPGYLKDLKRNGQINEADEQKLADSLYHRLKFEIKNMFTLGNRVTFGRITTFVPVFDRENVLRGLEQCYLSPERVNENISRIRSIDYSAFCRQGVCSIPEAGVNSFYTDNEVLPFVILMPNVGSRSALWQEIDAKKRSTPGRMIISVFHTENLEDTMIRLVGDFRWEMCKTEQGVHWNDITDPSLTSMYCDYLQFYRKNSALSQDTKEKLSVALKNNANNFKKVFLNDYYIYVKYESQGALRLNKTARGILFSACPFSAEIRRRIADNPQFAPLIEKHEADTAARLKAIDNIILRINKNDMPVPEQVERQAEFLKR